jgi:hypothetical protein
MPPAEVQGKADDLMTPVFGASRSAKIIDTVMKLEEVSDMTELRPLLQVG